MLEVALAVMPMERTAHWGPIFPMILSMLQNKICFHTSGLPHRYVHPHASEGLKSTARKLNKWISQCFGINGGFNSMSNHMHSGYTWTVSYPSTNGAQHCLTSLIVRELVLPSWQGIVPWIRLGYSQTSFSWLWRSNLSLSSGAANRKMNSSPQVNLIKWEWSLLITTLK